MAMNRMTGISEVKTGEFKVRWLGGQVCAPLSAGAESYDFYSFWRFYIKRWRPFSLNIFGHRSTQWSVTTAGGVLDASCLCQ